MSRDKQTLLSLTIRQLNQQYTRRVASNSTNNTSVENSANPILASHKVILICIFYIMFLGKSNIS